MNVPTGRPCVIIPAHNESRVIGRLLGALLPAGAADDFDIVVVCNGCTDNTAEQARQFGPTVRVLETPVASKKKAMDLGNELSSGFPRFFVDADIVITHASVMQLVGALTDADTHAVAPARYMPMSKSSFVVRSYYHFWLALPQMRVGLFGRGVIGLSREGIDRYNSLPTVMSDDLAISEAFARDERSIIPTAMVTVMPPHNLADLIRRRTRAVTGIRQVDTLNLRGDRSRTTLATVADVIREQPSAALHLPAFVFVTALSHYTARKAMRSRDFTEWQRDESSRN